MKLGSVQGSLLSIMVAAAAAAILDALKRAGAAEESARAIGAARLIFVGPLVEKEEPDGEASDDQYTGKLVAKELLGNRHVIMQFHEDGTVTLLLDHTAAADEKLLRALTDFDVWATEAARFCLGMNEEQTAPDAELTIEDIDGRVRITGKRSVLQRRAAAASV